MTDSQNVQIAGSVVTITTTVYPKTIDIYITVDLSPLDVDEPDHSPHKLIEYIQLPNYSTTQTCWWCKLHRKITVKTGSQARRVIKQTRCRIDDAISTALITRRCRKLELPSQGL